MTMTIARLLLVIALVLFSTSRDALAAGGGELSWTPTLLGFINFGIFLFLMRKFAWPLVTDYLQVRRLEIVQALEAAAQTKREAEALKAEFEKKMASLEQETEKAREELLAIARSEAAKSLAHAQEVAERLKADAKLLANQEVARARRALQEESAALITKIATEIVEKEMTDEDQQRFVEEFVTETQETSS